VYLTFFVGSLYTQFISKTDDIFGINIEYWVNKFESIYIFMMALLIIYLFRGALTSNKVCIYDKSVAQLVLYFGAFLLFIVHWREFLDLPPVEKNKVF